MALTEADRQRIAANKANAIRLQQQRINAPNPRPTNPAPRPVAPPIAHVAARAPFAPLRPSVAPFLQPNASMGGNRPDFNSSSRPGTSFSHPRQSFYRYPRPGYYQKNTFGKQPQRFSSFNQNHVPIQKPQKFGNIVSISVYNSEKFKLDMKPFLDPVKNFVQGYANRTYDSRQKCWTFPWNTYQDVKSKLILIKKEVEFNIEECPRSVVEFFCNKPPVEKPDNDLLSNLKVTMWNRLYDYQQAGILRGVENKGRIIIGDEMGLGKSVQGLGLAFYYRTEWPLLIVAPSSVKGSWNEQFKTFLPGLCSVTIIEKTSDIIPTTRAINDVIIISHDMMVRKLDHLLKANFYVIIFDESHMLKEQTAKRTKAAIKLAHAANRVILLSGTPAISRPAELFTQIKMVNPKIFPEFMEFATTYCDGQDTARGFIARGATRTEELTKILQETVLIRRTKENIALPKKTRHTVFLSEKNIDVHMKELKEAKEMVETAKGSERNQTLMEYYRTTALVKASAVTSYVKNEYVDNGINRKMLIFAHHLVVLDAVSSLLISSGVDFIRIDGATQKRTELVERFQTDEKCKVAVLSMTAAGVGITLTSASIVLFAELHWNPSTLMQAEDRAHRVGQTRPVDVYYLIARKTSDDQMLRLIKQKMCILSSVSLNTGSLDHTKESHEEPGNLKITQFFQSLAENEDGEVITLDENDEGADDDAQIEWGDDDIFCEPPVSSTTKKRESDGIDNDIPVKRSK